jgi:hypothetical protein
MRPDNPLKARLLWTALRAAQTTVLLMILLVGASGGSGLLPAIQEALRPARITDNGLGYRLGHVRVHPNLQEPLEKVAAAAPDVWEKCLLEGRFIQGYGDYGASSGTHLEGWALDIATGASFSRGIRIWKQHPPLTEDEIRRLVKAFEEVEFAAPLRVVGYDLGNGHINQGEHIHAVYRDKANFDRCWNATRSGGRACLEQMLAARSSMTP